MEVRKVFYSWIFIFITFFLAACGGGGGGGNSSNSNDNSATDVKFAAKIGQALLGPIVGANVEVYDFAAIDQAPFCTATTAVVGSENGPGTVDLSRCSFDDAGLYYLVVKGGEDIDADDNGILDDVPTPKEGVLHALITGAEINSGGWRINILTELAYQRSLQLLASKADLTRLIDSRDETAELVLNVDLNNDGVINGRDLAQFVPRDHMGALKNRDVKLLLDIVESMHNGSLNIAELSNRYLLGRIGTFTFGDTFNDFIGFKVVLQGSYQYYAGHISEADPSYDPGTISFRVLDASSPLDLKEVGALDISGFSSHVYPYNLWVEGNLLYVSLGSEGLLIIDVSDPTSLRLLHKFVPDTPIQDVVAFGQTVFVASFAGIYVLDVTDPASPAQVNLIDGIYDRLVYENGRLYTCGDEIKTFDVSDPGNAMEVASVANDDACVDMVLHDGILYVSDWGVHRFDVSDPATINPLPSIAALAEGGTRLVADGDGLFVFGPELLSSLRLAGFDQPTLLDSRNASFGTDMTVAGDIVYLLAGYEVQMFDRNSLDEAVNNFLNISTPEIATKVAVANRVLYVADGNHLMLMDISNPRESVEPLSTLQLPDHALDFHVEGILLYIADSVAGLVIVDVSDPYNPEILGSNNALNQLSETTWTDTTVVAVKPGYAYISFRNLSKLAIIDVSDPTNPVLSGTLDQDVIYGDFDVVGDLLYIANENGLWIYDLSNPAMPTALSHVYVPAGYVYVEDGYAYLSGWQNGLSIVDVSNPSSPIVQGKVTTLGIATGITVHNQIAYVSNLYGRLDIFDVRDPAHPIFATQARVNGNVYDVVKDSDYLYMANGFGIAVEPLMEGLSNLN